MYPLLLTLMLALAAPGCLLAQDCSAPQLDTLGEEVTHCVLRHQDTLEDTVATFTEQVYIQEAACGTVGRILQECSSMWRSCYTETEVEQLKSLQLSSLKSHLADRLDLASCPLEVEEEVDVEEVEDTWWSSAQGPEDAVEEEQDAAEPELDVDGCSDELCQEGEEQEEQEVAAVRRGLIGRLLSVFSGRR